MVNIQSSSGEVPCSVTPCLLLPLTTGEPELPDGAEESFEELEYESLIVFRLTTTQFPHFARASCVYRMVRQFNQKTHHDP